MAAIVSDDDIRSGEPRIDGSRIAVLDVKRRVIDAEADPHVVAGEYDISMAGLFTALTYYYENRDEFSDLERAYETSRLDGERRIRERLAGEADTAN